MAWCPRIWIYKDKKVARKKKQKANVMIIETDLTITVPLLNNTGNKYGSIVLNSNKGLEISHIVKTVTYNNI